MATRTISKSDGQVVVESPNIGLVRIRIRGTAPFVQSKFSLKTRLKMMAAMATPKAAKKSRTDREPRDYDSDFQQAQHISTEGWHGIPAPAFRAAMVSACRTVGIVMTRAKLAVFVVADGIDEDDGTPLVRLLAGRPERSELPVRNATGGADIRVRPMWRTWEAVVSVRFDMDMITTKSVVNLLSRAGLQVGVGEGRPDSKSSCGQGWGTFEIVEAVNEA